MAGEVWGIGRERSQATERFGAGKCTIEKALGRCDAGQRWAEGVSFKKELSGQDQRQAVAELQAKGLSERAACESSGVTRRVARYRAKQPERDAVLEAQIRTALKAQPEFGYRQAAGFIQVSEDRVRRLWERLGLKCERPKKSRRKVEPNSEPRPHRAEFPNHVWSYDFMHDRLFDRSAYRLLNILDEYTRECLTIHVSRSIKSEDVIRVLWEVMKTTRRKPKFLRSDNGAEFTAPAVTHWLAAQQVGPAFIDLGSPWQTPDGRGHMVLLNRLTGNYV